MPTNARWDGSLFRAPPSPAFRRQIGVQHQRSSSLAVGFDRNMLQALGSVRRPRIGVLNATQGRTPTRSLRHFGHKRATVWCKS
jgi:hypothetical protein